jgi:hypothetical protein
MPAGARADLFIRSASVRQFENFDGHVAGQIAFSGVCVARSPRVHQFKGFRIANSCNSASASQNCRMQVATRARFSVTRKILLPASDKDALRCFDWMCAYPGGGRARIFSCVIGNFQTQARVSLSGVIILRLRDLGSVADICAARFFGGRS